MKRIRLTEHAQRRAVQRGASEDEIKAAVSGGRREPARRGKWQARVTFPMPFRSPVDGKVYNAKVVEAVFAEERDQIVVVTVKVYYSVGESESEDRV